MPPARPNRAMIVRLVASILALALVGVVSATITPRSYLPIVMRPRATVTATASVTAIASVTATPSVVVTPNPSATPRSTNGIPSFSHVFIIVLENKEYSSIIGKSSAPYLNSLAQQYGLATNSYGTTHPSLPNYLSLIGGDTFGVTSNCNDCFINAPNLAGQLETAGKSWKAYIEAMPSPCFIGDDGKLYRQKHNPFIYFDNIRLDAARCQKIVPFTEFAADLQSNSVPEFTWITPDMCNSMHDCSVGAGDAWVQTWVPRILASPAWKDHGVLFITFDEGTTDVGCCTHASGGQIMTLVISPLGKPAHQSAIAYDHYSLLRTIENAWGLPELAGASCTCTATLADFFSGAATGRQP